jgi:hypothetical protein
MDAASRPRRRWLVAALLAGAAAARAEDRVIFEAIGGWESSPSNGSYAFATAGASPHLTGGLRLPVRLTASDLRYSFDTAGATTSVRSPGVTLLVGLGLRGAAGGVVLSGGGELRWERRQLLGTAEPASTIRRAGAVAQLEGDFAMGRRLRTFLLANYAGAARYTYARAALRCQLSPLEWRGPLAWFAGIEATSQGNADTRAAQLGGSVEATVVRASLSVGLHGGYEESWSPGEAHRRRPYGALSFYERF